MAKRVAWRVSSSGPLVALFDGLTGALATLPGFCCAGEYPPQPVLALAGVSSASLVVRAQEHFRPPNPISYLYLLVLAGLDEGLLSLCLPILVYT